MPDAAVKSVPETAVPDGHALVSSVRLVGARLGVLRHERRPVVRFGVTAHPTAPWIARQLREAFPFDEAPRYLIRDRDGVYGDEVRRCLESMGIEEVVIAPRSPWQSPFVERMIGTLRRECLNHFIVLNERHLKRIVAGFLAYYHQCRPHMSLHDNAPDPRQVERPEQGRVVGEPSQAFLC